jgi:hypothetical protein
VKLGLEEIPASSHSREVRSLRFTAFLVGSEGGPGLHDFGNNENILGQRWRKGNQKKEILTCCTA